MAEDEIDEPSKLPPDARLESLDERLDAAHRREVAKAAGAANADEDANSRAGRLVVSQLIGGPLGGAIVGWVLDRWIGTAPWLMLGLMFVGFAGGLINVIRISSTGHSKSAGGIED